MCANVVAMKKENVYFYASKDAVDVALGVFAYLQKFDSVLSKFVLKYSVVSKAAEAADIISGLVSDTEHRGLIVSQSGNGALIRANMYPCIRAGFAVSPEHAIDSRERALCNTLVFASKFQSVEQVQKIALAFLLTEISEEREALLIEKQKRRRELTVQIADNTKNFVMEKENSTCSECILDEACLRLYGHDYRLFKGVFDCAKVI